MAAPNPTGEFAPLTPARILDTGDGNGTEGKTDPIEANSSIDVQVTGRGGVPETGGLGGPAQTVPNLVTVRVTADGMLSFYNAAGQTHVLAATAFVLYDAAGEVHLIVDVFGLFTDSSGPSVRQQR